MKKLRSTTACLITGLLCVVCGSCRKTPPAVVPPTFYGDIAEILHSECAECHRPDGGGPFSLLTYEDAADHADQIADVVASRFMPPWPPDSRVNSFLDERTLAPEEIQQFRAWAEAGAPAGPSAGSAFTPSQWARKSAWALGTPDLVVSFAAPYEVPAEATDDIYRNFVIPVPVERPHYVHAIEIRPTNLQVAHHMFVRIDRTGAARALSGQDGSPGFEGMERPPGIAPPQGCILSWQVGKQPSPEPEGVAWRLEPNSDFVIECHLQPTGKREPLDIQIGLHFTDQRPTKHPVLINLRELNIDIPSGEADYHTKMEYTLPVDATATAVLPHAHYLGHNIQGYADLPNGQRQPLVSIPDWNFNWQGEYRYQQPIRLPAGTKIVMDFQFDNTAENPFNPSSPPKRVRYGPQSKDEMAELAVQLIPDSRADFEVLRRDFSRWQLKHEVIPYGLRMLSDPATPVEEQSKFRVNLGKAYIALGDTTQAEEQLQQATRLPNSGADPWFYLGRLRVAAQDLDGGKAYFERALALDRRHLDTLNGLGLVAMRTQRPREAIEYFQRAIQIQPQIATFHYNQGLCYLQLKAYSQAKSSLQKTVEMEPGNQKAARLLSQLERQLPD